MYNKGKEDTLITGMALGIDTLFAKIAINNGIPFIAAHSHEDDCGFYHRGLQELLEDNMIQEQTAKGQLMDCRTLLNFRPLVRLQGRVKNKDMKISHNTVFDVTDMNAIKQLEVSDLTGTISQSLQFLTQESQQLSQTPPFMLGEGLGSRTSATEFAAIRDQSSAPALNDIKNLNMQFSGGYMRKLKEYATQFFDHDVTVPFTTNGAQGEEAMVTIKPEDFNMDMHIEDVSIQEFENKATMRTILLNLGQFIVSPAVAPFINMAGFLTRLFKSFSTAFPNPDEIMNKDPQVMALMQLYLSQKPPPGGPAADQSVPRGAMPTPQPGGPPQIGAPVGLQNPSAVALRHSLIGYQEGQTAAAAGGQNQGL